MNTLLALTIPQEIYAVAIVAFVILGIVGAVLLTSSIVRLILLIKFNRYAKEESHSGMTALQAARAFLDSNGLQDVKVEKLGFFRMLFYGDHYNIFKRTIYLRKRLLNSNSITAVGIALQKVGLALQHKEGGKQFKVKSVLAQLAVFGPILFLPIAAIGLIVDVFVFDFSGLASIIGVAVAFLFYVVALIFTVLNIKVEKRANEQALVMLEKSHLFDEEDLEKIKSLFRMFIISYVLDMVLAILKIIYYFFKLFGQTLLTQLKNK